MGNEMHAEYYDILAKAEKDAKAKMEVFFQVKFEIEDVLKHSTSDESRVYWEQQLFVMHSKAKAYETIYDAIRTHLQSERSKV